MNGPTPDRIDITFFRGMLTRMFETANDAGGEAVIAQAVQDYPADAHLRYEAGMFFDKRALSLRQHHSNDMQAEGDMRGLRAQAFLHFRAASDMVPGRYLYAFRAGATARRLGEQLSGAYLARALAVEPENAFAWTELGRFFNARQQRNEALACWRNALRVAPGDRIAGQLYADMRGPRITPGQVDRLVLSMPVLKMPQGA